ncbi:aspartate aminotransferase family protein [Beijerinckia mobilis]|uniref:aspartate aminotransferase family protein n=1 Tax=Beijerinckia mobilis TaxID=231434 RepID=UPI000556DDAE|nr:aspartate aminotransferase family protein [Beijerinckia mobilis]
MTSSLLPTYARAPIAFEKGEGAWLTATTGELYLDFGGGIAVASLGYSHPHLIKTLHEQGDKLWHTSNLFQIPQAERLAERLCAASFADYAFFTNSGAEALEGVIKTARKYHSVSGNPHKTHMITFQGAFHGRTLATIAAAGNEKYLDGFEPRLPGFHNVAFGDLDAVKAALSPEIGAILIEPIQGEGGIRVAPAQFLKALRALCDEHGLLLLFDEVQSGVGRSGKLFAYELSGVMPDVMAIAKGIGGGFPLGAFLATKEAAKGMTVGTHGTTYGGNPLATSIGNAVLDIVLEPGFLAQVTAMGELLQQKLHALQDRYPGIILEVRGEGLMRGLKVAPPVADFTTAARAQKLLVIPAGDNVARLLPPLIIGAEEIEEAVLRLDAACQTLASPQLSGAAE